VTDGTLGAGFEILEKIEGVNEGTGGESTAYLYRKACAGEGGE